MMRFTLLLLLTFTVCVGAATAAEVPCNVFAAGNCPNPIVQGVVDGQWIALIYHYNGTNSGPDSINVVTVGAGGNGYLTSDLQRIAPVLDGDRMDAQFASGKLWVKNAIYLPNEAHCCYTHISVRQFGFRNKRLYVERSTTVRSDATQSQIQRALSSARPGA